MTTTFDQGNAPPSFRYPTNTIGPNGPSPDIPQNILDQIAARQPTGFDQYGNRLSGPGARTGSDAGSMTSAPPGTLTAAPAGGTQAQQDANAIITQLLNYYGLGSLAQWVWQQITQGASVNQIDLQLRQTDQFKNRFPGITARERAGLPPISPGEYVAYENQARQLERQYGLPPGSIPVNDFIGNDTSFAEITNRVQNGLADAMAAPQQTRDQLQRLYGVTAGDLTHFFLDPAAGQQTIMRRYAAAQLAAQAQQTGYNPTLDRATAEQLAALGITPTQAQTGFSQLGRESQLFQPLPGSPEDNIDQQAQLGAQFQGNAFAQQRIANRAAARVAAFAGGGGFATSQTGAEGLGLTPNG